MKRLFLIPALFFLLKCEAQSSKVKPDNFLFIHIKTIVMGMEAEQIANLKTKGMTLLLDLTDEQVAKIYKINFELVKERKKKLNEFKARKSKPDPEKMYSIMDERLNKLIELKKEMAIVLS